MFSIDIDKIDPNPEQPRKNFSGLEGLAESIRTRGLLEPIMVRPIGDRYQIVHGERRWRAAKLANLMKIEAIVKEIGAQEAYEISLVENVQRENLTPMEEAWAFKKLQEQGYKQEAIASMTGKTQSYVAHKLRLLKLPEPITFYLQRGVLTENHIRQIAKFKNIYGPHLPGDFSSEPRDELIKDEKTAGLFLCQLRPEEKPRFWPLEPGAVIVEACRLFADYVSKHNAGVRQWEVAAFWWASVAVYFDLTVANLTLALDRWRERYEDALVAWNGWWKDGPVPEDREGARIYWGFWADLRHSASLSEEAWERPGHEEKALQRLRRMAHKRSYVLPSEMQWWSIP